MKTEYGKILIVDDTPANIDILNKLLENYKRSIALNGKEALKILSSGLKPDLILLDVLMPELDGFET
ncbi:MAG: response regulator, partial [Chlorobi bacterium]|nr:response regulator [Chlorobiota bacterium]